ncbi:MAG: hypothetical protein AB1689_26445 [Thermodesulfobacteriota bacterium]
MFSFERTHAELRAAAQESTSENDLDAVPEYYRQFVMHPYLGYAFDPSHVHWQVDLLGFTGAMEAAPEHSVEVVITGGSLAWNFSRQAQDTLRRHLERVPAFVDRPVRFVSLATVGFKQPQQLFSLIYYLLVTRRRPDVVINIDGFNEVTHVPQGRAAPIYPGYWNQLALDVRSPSTNRALLELTLARTARQTVASWSLPLRYCVSCMVTWQALDGAIAARIEAKLRRFARAQSLEKTSYLRHGPSFDRSDAERWRALADYWRDSSLLMHHLSRRLGFHYLHVLQPNQHLLGTKPLSDEERSIVPEGGTLGSDVRTGYALLLERARDLAAQRVSFLDATRVYEHTTESLYVDECCHVNELGSRILAEAIGEKLRQGLAVPSSSGS